MNRVNAPDGTPLVYDAYEPERPTVAVLFLHDWNPQPPESATQFADTGAQLREAGFATYFLDQRGHGRSGGRRGHLSRFSQLLGDLQTFRRAVRRRHAVPQVLVGHGFGGLIVLRYLETQPGEPPAAAVVACPWLASRVRPAAWKRLAPLLLLLGETDAMIDASTVRGLAGQLGSRATLLAYPRLGHELLEDSQVRTELTSFIAEFRSFDRNPKSD